MSFKINVQMWEVEECKYSIFKYEKKEILL